MDEKKLKILMVNNRLTIYGGDGTYTMSVGDELIRQGHTVEYFGIQDIEAKHGNTYNIYAKKSRTPLQLIRNKYNRKKFAKLLDIYKPDIVHLNLIYFTLTPSILLETKKRNIPVVQTVHDGKIMCPSYQLYIKSQNKPCTECQDGNFKRCVKTACFKNSKLYSYIAYLEACYNRKKNYYSLIDKFVFPSNFMRELHLNFGINKEKTQVLTNFSRVIKRDYLMDKSDKYVIYFGRLTKIKGIDTIISVAKMLPNIRFLIVGNGDMEKDFEGINNCTLVGFKSGKELEDLIARATVAIFPSVCNENCPMALQEAIALGTPVIGAKIGGIPELITENVNGFIFESGNASDLSEKILSIYDNDELANRFARNCIEKSHLFDSKEYVSELVKIYESLVFKDGIDIYK